MDNSQSSPAVMQWSSTLSLAELTQKDVPDSSAETLQEGEGLWLVFT